MLLFMRGQVVIQNLIVVVLHLPMGMLLEIMLLCYLIGLILLMDLVGRIVMVMERGMLELLLFMMKNRKAK